MASFPSFKMPVSAVTSLPMPEPTLAEREISLTQEVQYMLEHYGISPKGKAMAQALLAEIHYLDKTNPPSPFRDYNREILTRWLALDKG